MESVSAYVDNFEEIRIEVARYFYNGESNAFYVVLEDGRLQELVILNKIHEQDKVVYFVKWFEGLQIGNYYEIVEEHAYRCCLQYRYIVRNGRFDREFYYAEDDLGVTYSPESSTFKLWAPIADKVLLNVNDMMFPMKRGAKGVFELCVHGDIANAKYTYMVHRNGEWVESVDPYAIGSTLNSKKSVVVNPKEVEVTKYTPKMESPIPIIYEVSVRDFTSSLKNCHRGTFKGFITEELRTSNGKLAGFDYLKSLGVTHVQFMPMYDFFTVDEENKFKFYNWGYDPIQYNVPEGSFASNPLNPLSRIIECKQMIEKCHKENMYVIMDVVYNHMYDRKLSAFDKIVPCYYFRMNEWGEYSNGSFCGNDFDSTRLMARAYIVNSTKHWMKFYGVDGFRFDLMGILDVDTMNAVVRACREIKPNCMFYGEGWNMPTMLEEPRRAHMFNAYQLPEVGFFNDSFRDITKGKSSEGEIGETGYLTGNLHCMEAMKQVLKGNTCSLLFNSPLQSINYVECHDNATAYDKLRMCVYEEGEDNWKKRAKLLMGCVMLAQGIPFIHAGQEFLRTKDLRHNTYNSSDEINTMDYELKDNNMDVVRFTMDLIEFRKHISNYTKLTYQEVERDVECEDMGNGVLAYRVKAGNDVYVTYFNPTLEEFELENKEGICVLTSEAMEDYILPPISMCVIKEEK